MTDTVALRPARVRFWPQGWWKIVEFHIGIVPLPIYVLLAALVAMLFLAVAVKVYLVTAEGTADPAKKINTSVAPFLPESLLPRHVHRADVRSGKSADRARRPLPLTAGG